tara:strand:- start:1200 stop:2003 length:804 start_codon:yes stop_codon:yes gene_type:complete
MDNSSTILGLLKRRGFTFLSWGNLEHLLIPENRLEDFENRFYELLKKYSFRIFLRDIIKYQKGFFLKDIVKYSTEETINDYLALTTEFGITKSSSENHYQLISSTVYSFGETLEWFIARVLMKEFQSHAEWGVKLRDNKSGGDYDVIAMVENNFVYIEVKSSPPKHIELNEVIAFLKRVDTLRPNLAIFFNDTELRMKDKIVVLFEEALKHLLKPKKANHLKIKRVYEKEEMFSIKNEIFIINSKPDLISNLGKCFSNYFAEQGINI